MALSAEEKERILEEVSDEYSAIMAEDTQESIDNDTIELYTDEELLANSVDESVANSYDI